MFLINGGVLGVVAWALQLGLFHLMGGEDSFDYAVAATLAYPPLVVTNFLIQQKLIFAQPGRFLRFVLVNLVVTALVSIASPGARLVVQVFLEEPWGSRTGFMIAALAIAPLSFLMQKLLVFRSSG